jgi:hypothetical protein
MKTEYKYIHFVEKSDLNKKTKNFCCLNNSRGASYLLGSVHWYAPWKEYCFFPRAEVVFSGGCLKDINDFLEQLKAEREEKCQPL